MPVYASTYLGDNKTGLNCKEAYAEFAQHCYELGFRAYKIHGWNEGDARKEAENVLHVAAMVGDRMSLMLDPANQLRKFSDALYVGRACDEANYFWYEDPMRDNGKSAFMHQKLRSMIKTPLLITEYIRGIEPKADFVIAGGTDFCVWILNTTMASPAACGLLTWVRLSDWMLKSMRAAQPTDI